MYVKNCPKCGGIVIKDDTYDTEKWDDGLMELHCGHCIKCGTNYQWESYYRWSVDSELEES